MELEEEEETLKKFQPTIPSWTPYNYVIAATVWWSDVRNRTGCESPKCFFPPAGHLFLQKHTENDFYECKVESQLLPTLMLTSDLDVVKQIVTALRNMNYMIYRDVPYRGRLKSMQILLSRTQPEPGRTGKQEQ